MFRTNFLKAIAALCIVSLAFVACNKEESLISDLELRTIEATETENRLAAVTLTTENPKARRGGKCFKLNFPVSIVTPDNVENAIADHEALKAFFKTYRAEGGEKGDLMFAYPIEVTLENGTLQSVASQEEMETLKESCPQKERGEGRGNAERCFSITFPVTATATDGSTLTLEGKRDFKKFKRSVKMALENGETVPTLNFPIEITTEEGSVNIASQTTLDDLIESCKQN